MSEALVKAGTEVTISGHPARVVRILRDAVLIRVQDREIAVDFDKVELAVRQAGG